MNEWMRGCRDDDPFISKFLILIHHKQKRFAMITKTTGQCLDKLTQHLFNSVADLFPITYHSVALSILKIQLQCMISVESRCGTWRTEIGAEDRSYFPYIGRGWFQLTHKSNYRRAMSVLNVDEDRLIQILTDSNWNETQLLVWYDYFRGFRTRFIHLFQSRTLINARTTEKRKIIALVWTPVSLVVGTTKGDLDRVLFYRQMAEDPVTIDRLLNSN